MRFSVLILSLTLIFLNCPTCTNGKSEEVLKSRLDYFVGKIYESSLFVVSWLRDFVPNFRSRPNECPESAVKYLRDPPHNWYIVPREKDIEDLKKLFDSFNNLDNKVSVVHIFGVPGSGKTELARQFGKSVFCEPNGSYTVLTLNTESPEHFRSSLIVSIWKIKKSERKEFNYDASIEIRILANQLKNLLKKRPGWLLIVDNIRDPSITRKDMYKLLPTPGTDEWGTGKMLVTTQIPLPFRYNVHVRIKHNTLLTLENATKLLCKVVEQKTNRSCDAKAAEEIVKVLEILPLTILAAGDYISRKIGFNYSYSCRDYLTELGAKNFQPAHNKLASSTYGYPHSMSRALQLTIEETGKVYSNVFYDFIALIGFTSRREGYISSTHVENYLKMRGHKHDYVFVYDFPLVYFSQQRFQVHQVVSFAFRQALERSETDEMLQHILRNISLYFANQVMYTFHITSRGFGDSKSNIYFEYEEHFSALVHNLPTRYPHLSDCLITPEWKNEDIEAVSSLIFKTYEQRYSRENRISKLNCSKLDNFLFQLAHSPHYINRVAVQIRFKGLQALYICLRKLDKVNGSFLAATAAIQLIKEVAPERSVLHTVPVSWILLSLSLEVEYFEEILLNKNAFRFLPFPPRLNGFTYDASKIRHKSCSFLHNVTQILSWNLLLKEKVITLCIPDLNNSTVMSEMIALISSVYKTNGPFAVNDKLPLMLNFHIPLGRSCQITQPNRAGAQNNSGRINPYGACLKSSLPDIETGEIFRFYIDWDKRVGLERVEIVLRKYSGVIHFLNMMRHMAEKRTIGEIDCRLTKNQLKALHELQPTFNAGTELKMQNSIGIIMESFYKVLLRLFDNYCDVLPKNLNPETLSYWDDNYEYHLMLRSKHFLDEFLRDKEFQQDQTKEITEMVKEIRASTKHDLSNGNFQFGIELIPSDMVQAKNPELIQGLHGYG